MSKELELIAGVLDDEVPSTTGLRLTEVEAREMAECVVSKLSEYGYSIVPSDPGTCVDDPMGTHRWMPTNYPWQWCPDCRLRKHDAFAAAEGES